MVAVLIAAPPVDKPCSPSSERFADAGSAPARPADAALRPRFLCFLALLVERLDFVVGGGVNREPGFRWLPHDEPAPEEQIVQRADFANFVLQSDKLAPEVTEAVIEIVAPVITYGDIQWKGRWNDQAISFTMNDKAYEEEVLHNRVSFQHGDSIRCVLESELKLDELGDAKVTGHHGARQD
jgi:hypothetical protein